MPDFDVIIVGGGHAGVEAALAVARMGHTAGLVTMDRNKLALMSCNPAIGGLGKSHIVKEIDALGGLMGEAIDASGIQFRKLNLSRGPAVWATRAQADRQKYTKFISHFVSTQKNIEVIEGIADALLSESGRVIGVNLESGESILGRAVILSTGTFLGGLIHIGEQKIKAGRKGEPAAYGMTESLIEHGFEVGRLKTGTPPRIDGKTINYDLCEIQPGMNPIPFFSHHTDPYPIDQTSCYLTYTTTATKEIIMANLNRSAMFSGQIHSIGPRYCPSIEDKMFRFNDKPRHQIFLEPEGNGTDEVYPNGFSTSLPEDVQDKAIRTITGLENVVVTQPGYAIEYDYCPSYQIKPSLETKLIENLFLAGQINGTSGYEEAGGLGLVAGVNAVLKIKSEPPFIPDRSESYLGVMIDDLITHSTTEPYRMFTSRAEYRLHLREDNARDRLAHYAIQYSLIPQSEYDDFQLLQKETNDIIETLKRKIVPVAKLGKLSELFVKRESISIADLMKVPGVEFSDIVPYLDKNLGELSAILVERVSISIKYEGYIQKQSREVEKFKQMESDKIPEDFNYQNLTGFRNEAKEKFIKFRPTSLGQAGRIEGVTIGDLSALSIHLRKHNLSSRKK